jgi:adenosylcobinamide-phosphate synthase
MTRGVVSLPRALAAASGLALDRLFDEPPSPWHPVVHFGRLMNDFEQDHYRDTRSAGALHTVVGSLVGAGAGALVRSNALATALSVGGRSLHLAARDVSDALSRGDLERARELLPTLVGRDPSALDEPEIARAVVESVAENTVDAVVAPALWASVAGAKGALGYRAINTMDAMVGHHSTRYEHYGWASARLDDVANWVPARVTAGLVALVRPKAARAIRVAVTTQAPAHPSPNAGVSEAAFAAALGLTLGGRNDYRERVEERPLLGNGRPADVRDIEASIRLSRDVTAALCALLGLVGLSRWRRR